MGNAGNRTAVELSSVVDMCSEWMDNSLMRAVVRQHKQTFVIEVTELTEGRTSKQRALDFAKVMARKQPDVKREKGFRLSDVQIERKGERLDGTKVLTHVRTTAFLFA